MEILISLVTKEGQTVLDPFCGCGTTLVAAKKLNREYIGFEINEEFYNNILLRMDDNEQQWKSRFFDIVITDKYQKEYWLIIEVNENILLKDLDNFIS